MTTAEINKRFCELAGICWHERRTDTPYSCSCGEDFSGAAHFYWHKDSHPNPDFCADPRLVLAVMMKQENFGEFLREIGGNGDDIEYAPCVPISLILDKTGQLALKAISWMEAQNPKAPLCDGCMYKNNSWYCDNYHNREKCTKYVLDSETQSGWRKTPYEKRTHRCHNHRR